MKYSITSVSLSSVERLESVWGRKALASSNLASSARGATISQTLRLLFLGVVWQGHGLSAPERMK
jgi:hypothetical protein